MRRGWSEFTGTASDGIEIVNTQLEHPPLRFKVKLFYKGKEFMTIPIEMSREEGRSLDSIELISPGIQLDRVQLPDIGAIPVLPIRYQIAQKLHACTEDLGEEKTNQRVRDISDLLLIVEAAVTDEDLPAIREACVEIFDLRQKHSWPPLIVVWPDWPLLWERLAQQEELEFSVQAAVDQVQEFVKRIDRN